MLNSTEIGKPVTLGKEDNSSASYHRIVEHVDNAATFGGLVSRVRIATPHGSIIETGIGYLFEISQEGLKKLQDYEEDARRKNSMLYAGKFDLK